MLRLIKSSLTLLAITASVNLYGFSHDYPAWNRTLKSHLDGSSMVAYKSLAQTAKDPQSDFNQALKNLASVSYQQYQSFSADQQKAFLINAYNAYTLKLIVDHPDVASIKDIGGLFTKPWSIEFFSLLSGKIKSLDPIEHEWLRPKFKDYRIHAACNCASISCPTLRREAYTAAKLNQQLDEQMQLWIRDPARNQLAGATAKISKIFDWYESDFSWGGSGGVRAVLKKYASADNAKNLTEKTPIEYLDYNWQLNRSSGN